VARPSPLHLGISQQRRNAHCAAFWAVSGLRVLHIHHSFIRSMNDTFGRTPQRAGRRLPHLLPPFLPFMPATYSSSSDKHIFFRQHPLSCLVAPVILYLCMTAGNITAPRLLYLLPTFIAPFMAPVLSYRTTHNLTLLHACPLTGLPPASRRLPSHSVRAMAWRWRSDTGVARRPASHTGTIVRRTISRSRWNTRGSCVHAAGLPRRCTVAWAHLPSSR